MQGTRVPFFGVGQTQGVADYLHEAIPEMGERIGLNGRETDELLRLALDSFDTAAAVMQRSLCQGLVEPTPAARRFWNAVGCHLIGPESALIGSGNLDAALEALAGGNNVLVIQNHRSGADSLVMEMLVDRAYGYDVTSAWAYMSGHAVNLFAIPLMFTLAVRRFQIFSAKYRSLGLAGTTDADMAQQNLRAMRALCNYCRPGGRLVVLYPEGGRGDHGLKLGEPQTMCVPQIMRRSGPRLLILPTYVHGSTNILRVNRGDNEYNEVFENMHRGTATFTVGAPLWWDELRPDSVANDEAGCDGADGNGSFRRAMIERLMRLIADLATDQQGRGVYA